MIYTYLSEERDQQLQQNVAEIFAESQDITEALARTTELVYGTQIDRVHYLAYEVSGQVFRKLMDENSGVTVHQVETLRHDRYHNIERGWWRHDDYQLVGKRALNFALSAYNVYMGGPRHTFDRTFGIQRSE